MHQIAERGALYYSPETLGVREGFSLAEELDYIDSNLSLLGLNPYWFQLDNYSVSTQVDMLINKGYFYNKEDWIRDTDEDLIGYDKEYLKQKLIFPIFYGIDEIGGKKSLVARNYGNKRVVDTISEEEREGAVKTAFEEIIEPFLISAESGSVAVMASPDGDSGLRTDKGERIVFPDSQTYIFQKMENEVRGFTVRTDFSLEEHREFLSKLGAEVHDNATARDVVLSIGQIDSSKYDLDIRALIWLMKESREDISGRIDAYEGRGWDEILSDISQRDKLWEMEDQAKDIIEDFHKFVLDNDWSELNRIKLEKALGLTIIRLAKSVFSNDMNSSYSYSKNFGTKSYLPNTDYLAVIDKLSQIAGCAGGGGGRGLISVFDQIITLGSPRKVLVEDSIESMNYNFDQPGPCVKCGDDVNCGPCGICKPCDESIRIMSEDITGTISNLN